MDIITLQENEDTYSNGQIVNGLTKKLWVERYRDAGDFKLTGPATRELRTRLDIDTLISHTGTRTVMIVEDHRIKESKNNEPELTITGRSLDAFLDQRVATDDDLGFSPPLYDRTAWPYTIEEVLPWEQATEMIRQQIEDGHTERSSFVIPNVDVRLDINELPSNMPGDDSIWVAEDKEIKREALFTALQSVLDEFEGGIKIERPVPGEHAKLWFVVHTGVNRRSTVQFTHAAGEIEEAEYLRSSRREKNAVYVQSRYRGIYVFRTGFQGFKRRILFLDANDLNVDPEDFGWGGVLAAQKIDRIMTRRANRAMVRRKQLHIVEPKISTKTRYVFRRDYNIGDLVWVIGNYDVSKLMRVTEFIETEEDGGEIGLPTLTAPWT